ncbi:MAG: Tat pathway signal protein [Rhodospirillaceae bacterium]
MTLQLSRRAAISTSAAGLAGVALSGCSGDADVYDQAAADLRRPLSGDPSLQELVRYATIAANSHNTQPWIFQPTDLGIDILPDFTRRTPVVDPDDHHLFASLGCATENLHLAAQASGQAGEVVFDSSEDGAARIDLRSSATKNSDLFGAIPARQCSRAVYEARLAPMDVVARLALAANSYGVEAMIITETAMTEDILALILDGNSRQVEDPAFVSELKDWLRFNPTAAMRTNDGLYSACSGNPTLPDWLGSFTFDMFFTTEAENKKYAEQIRSSSGLVVFVAATDDKEGWFNAGRAYQRFALQATADGLQNAFVNQTIEVPEMRRPLQDLLGLGERRPNLVVRFGYGPAMPQSLRRPATEVMV